MKCSDFAGDGCAFCQDGQGCGQCNYGTLTSVPGCGLKVCL